MPLSPGDRIGPFEVLSALGAGGMGEVYRATDTRLKRHVAIKVLPQSVAAEPDRVARFQREAEVLAALNHPHIAQIYGLEETAGTVALVMELVEGPTLAERIARGAIAIADALPIAKQIAQALEAAHERGIVHRDLKPANIKLRPDGSVKVLDFGLAKLTGPLETDVGAARTLSSHSPTMTSPAVLTGVSVILGTAAYMSPEQARGRQVDKRSDIWAFGCVLYEMLAGTRAFAGEDVSETLASIITKEPDWQALPHSTPPAVARLLRRCLQKDPARRLRDIADAQLDIDEAIANPAGQAVAVPQSTAGRLLPVATLLAGAALASGGVWLATRSSAPAPAHVTRVPITPTGPHALAISGLWSDIAITPDGSQIVYVGNNGTQLLVRKLDALEPVILAKGEFRAPFISPDGQWVGYMEGSQTIKKVALTGGPPVTIVRSLGNGVRGAAWALDGSFIYAGLNPEIGLQRVPATGEKPTVLTRPDRARGELNHWWPEVLPDGRHILYTVMPERGGLDAAEVAILDLQTGTSKTLIRGGVHGRYVRSGHLMYAASGALMAVRFDLAKTAVVGTPVSVVPQVITSPFGAVEAAVSADGTLVYVPGSFAATATRKFVWIDRAGKKTPLGLPPRTFIYPRIAPDGNRIVFSSPEQDYDLWLWDARRASLTRATFNPDQDSFPVWTPDGQRLIFTSVRGVGRSVYRQAADGTGEAERLGQVEGGGRSPSSISPDGTRLIFSQTDPQTGLDIMMMRLDRNQTVEPLVQTRADERNGEISPDGRWLAYQSDESGQSEIYVKPFPGVSGGKWLISRDGGTRPLWSHAGDELFYLAPSALMRVTVSRGPTWETVMPTKLFDFPSTLQPTYTSRTYDISPDGKRFLTDLDFDTAAVPLSMVIVERWTDELKRLLPER